MRRERKYATYGRSARHWSTATNAAKRKVQVLIRCDETLSATSTTNCIRRKRSCVLLTLDVTSADANATGADNISTERDKLSNGKR